MPPKITGTKDFRGPFALHVLDLLRQIRQTEQTVALEVEFKSYEVGMIYFDKGKLVHAEFRDKIGEEAFLEMLGERDGKYKKIKELSADVVSIERDAHALIDQSMEAKTGTPKELDLFEGAAAARVTEIEAGFEYRKEEVWSPPQTQDSGFQEEVWMKDWGKKTEGFIAACIAKPDGMNIMQTLADGVGEEPKILKKMREIVRILAEANYGPGKLRLETFSELCYIVALAEGYFLVVILNATWSDGPRIEPRIEQLVAALNETLEQA